jgi:hypothetical protein
MRGRQTWRMDNSIARKAEFELLKHRLLLRQLDEMPDVESHARVIYQAHVAAALASLTAYPFLIFPCLFEERARAASLETHHWGLLLPSSNRSRTKSIEPRNP